MPVAVVPVYRRTAVPKKTSSSGSTLHSTLHQPLQIVSQLMAAILGLHLTSSRRRDLVTILAPAVLLLVAALTGCGGSQYAPTPTCAAISFDNRTNGGATESQLQALWQQAQQELANQTITLNPVSVLVNGGVLQTVSPDSRATTVQPQCTAVIAVPDLTVVQLQAENPGVALQHNTDPTGVIHCPDGALAKYCHSYTASNNRAAYVSASQVLNFGATGWEFENIILARLGYNTAGR
jgi:hypothetical protein